MILGKSSRMDENTYRRTMVVASAEYKRGIALWELVKGTSLTSQRVTSFKKKFFFKGRRGSNYFWMVRILPFQFPFQVLTCGVLTLVLNHVLSSSTGRQRAGMDTQVNFTHD